MAWVLTTAMRKAWNLFLRHTWPKRRAMMRAALFWRRARCVSSTLRQYAWMRRQAWISLDDWRTRAHTCANTTTITFSSGKWSLSCSPNMFGTLPINWMDLLNNSKLALSPSKHCWYSFAVMSPLDNRSVLHVEENEEQEEAEEVRDDVDDLLCWLPLCAAKSNVVVCISPVDNNCGW